MTLEQINEHVRRACEDIARWPEWKRKGLRMVTIEPIKHRFENMQALLARIAEDEDAIGFIGCVLRRDGTMIPVSFEATRDQMAFAAAVWLRDCVEVE